jgi:8-oxo-dGTP diphosphatase
MIDVTCAIIEKERKVLCAQRSEHMKHSLKWEFPGGKQEAGETLEACLVREIKEELGLAIAIREKLPAIRHQYNNAKEICLHPFICTIQAGELFLKEHKQVAWLNPQELNVLDWVEADIPILHYYLLRKQT